MTVYGQQGRITSGGFSMERSEAKTSVLVAAQTEKTAVQIRNILPAGFGRVSFTDSLTAARQKLAAEQMDMLVVFLPLKDCTGLDAVVDLQMKYPMMGILLLVRSEGYEQTVYRVQDAGIMVLERPISTMTFQQTLNIMNTMRKRVAALSRENDKLRKKLDDERYISRAKGLLIEKGLMTEQEAHRYLEKQAMDNAISKKEIALRVIRDSGRIVTSVKS